MTPNGENWISWVLAATAATFTAIAGWLFRRQIERIDDLEKSRVTYEYLGQVLDSSKEEISLLRSQNTSEHKEIRGCLKSELNSINHRLDRLYSHISPCAPERKP